jgi:hypothetical protein
MPHAPGVAVNGSLWLYRNPLGFARSERVAILRIFCRFLVYTEINCIQYRL